MECGLVSKDDLGVDEEAQIELNVGGKFAKKGTCTADMVEVIEKRGGASA
jgi:UV DNA damage repair endonuclease